MGSRVLVVDDEQDVCRLLTFNLERAGYEATSVNSGSDALLTAARTQPALLILDLMLPDISGLDLCRKIRQDNTLRNIGILMLTAKGSDEERVEGLAAGADDYVVKPFNIEEILLRVKALCRRLGETEQATTQAPQSDSKSVLRCGSITLNPRSHEVTVGGERVNLRPLEYKLLAVMVAEPGRVFSREDLIRDVWEMEQVSSPRLVDVHIRRLRQNLASASACIETVPGFGYRATTD